jgi:3-hydroxyisobutyrate dehydrogenase-like beta-hydroxyacid dehydrogenase
MGGGMAANLLENGYQVIGYDIRPEAAERYSGTEFQFAGSIDEVVESCRQVHTCLWGDVFYAIAEKTLLPGAREGQIFVDHSTLSAPRIRKYAARFAEKRSVLLDAPVSGGTGGASAGTLAMFVGGDQAIFEDIKQSLLAMADPKKLFYGGESGKGQVLKIIQQLKDRILTLGRLEVLSFGVNESVPMNTALRVLGEDPAGDGPYATVAKQIDEHNEHALSCMFAEWKYYLEEAEAAGVPLPIIEAVNEFYQSGDLTTTDNVGRPGPWLWKELTGKDTTGR